MAQVVIFSSSPPSVTGKLFQGMKFWVAQRVPLRSIFIEQIRSNGGEIVAMESLATLMIADHARRDSPPGSYSFTFIEQCIKDGTIVDKEKHRAGPVARTSRPVGSLQSSKTGRNPYTAEDDRVLWRWVKDAEKTGGRVKGNDMYKQLERVNNRHPWQSWRDRYVKYVSINPPAGGPSQETPPTPPSEHTSEEVAQEPQESSATANVRQRSKELAQTPRPPHPTPTSAKTSFTEQDRSFLLLRSPGLQRLSVGMYLNIWNELALLQPSRSALEWRAFYETEILPVSQVEIQTPRASEKGAAPTREMAPEFLDQPALRSTLDISPPTRISRPPFPSQGSTVRADEQGILGDHIDRPKRSSDVVAEAESPLQSSKRLRLSVTESQEIYRQVLLPHGLNSQTVISLTGDSDALETQGMPSSESGEEDEDEDEDEREEEEEEEEESNDQVHPNSGRFEWRASVELIEQDLHEPVLPPRGSIEHYRETREIPQTPDVDFIEIFEDDQDPQLEEDQENLANEIAFQSPDAEVLGSEDRLEAFSENPVTFLLAGVERYAQNGTDRSDEDEADKADDESDDAFETAPQHAALDTQAFLDAETQEPDLTIPPPAGDQWRSPTPDSATSPGSAGIAEATVEDVDAWIAQQQALGHTEYEVLDALRRTTMDSALAELLLGHSRIGNDLPEPMPGVWTDEHDRIMKGGDAGKMKNLEEFHGKARYRERLRAMQEW